MLGLVSYTNVPCLSMGFSFTQLSKLEPISLILGLLWLCRAELLECSPERLCRLSVARGVPHIFLTTPCPPHVYFFHICEFDSFLNIGGLRTTLCQTVSFSETAKWLPLANKLPFWEHYLCVHCMYLCVYIVTKLVFRTQNFNFGDFSFL